MDLARARQVKTALIQRAFGALSGGPATRSVPELIRSLRAVLRGEAALPEPIDPAATIPLQDPERLAEAVRRVLPELVGLDRYERPRICEARSSDSEHDSKIEKLQNDNLRFTFRKSFGRTKPILPCVFNRCLRRPSEPLVTSKVSLRHCRVLLAVPDEQQNAVNPTRTGPTCET